MPTFIPGLAFRPLTPRQTRIRGALLIIVGLFLIALTVCLMGIFLDLIPLSTFFPGVYRDPEAGPTSPPAFIWLCVGFFTVFGLVTFAQGVYQIDFGARNRVFMIIMIVMLLIFAAAGILARALR